MDKKPINCGKKNGEINRQTEKKMILKKVKLNALLGFTIRLKWYIILITI